MKYKLNPAIGKITSPVVLIMDDKETEYSDGKIAADNEFDKNYLVDSMFAKDNKIFVVLKENDMINNTNWVGEEQVSFF